MRSLSRLIPVILLALVASDAAAQRIYHLSIGDPARKTKDAPVVLDAIVDTASGETITSPDPAKRRNSRRQNPASRVAAPP